MRSYEEIQKRIDDLGEHIESGMFNDMSEEAYENASLEIDALKWALGGEIVFEIEEKEND